jgi:hypothetical protein
MTRIRSPNYPQLSLPAAIDRVAKVYQEENRHPAPSEVVVKHLGFSGLNGSSAAALSALLKYGLLEKEGKQVRVSDRTLAILYPQDPKEKSDALKQAIHGPALFSEILTNFKYQLPSDENLKAYLIRRGFAQGAIKQLIPVLRESVEFVPFGSDLNPGANQERSIARAEQPLRSVAAINRQGTAVSTASMEPMYGGRLVSSYPITIPLSKEPSITISLDDDLIRVNAVVVDQAGVDRLIKYLQANRELLPAKWEKPLEEEEEDVFTAHERRI